MSPVIGQDAEITVSANSVFERITAEEIWACTSCKACDEICPVNIEILDKILDMRRYLSLMESNFPTELGNAYRSMENQENPWGMSQSERADWAKAHPRGGAHRRRRRPPFDHEYLYWVGCAGSFDDKNKKVTVATAKLLHRAGIDFAILGPSEKCTGDPARRSGNEYIFQMLATQNVETLNGMGVKKIITQCPHCFNTLANEYPQLGGNYEVVHHSQFLEWLIASGKLDMGERVARRSASCTTTPATWAATTTSTWRPAACSARSRASRSSRRPAAATRACAAAPAAPACGWRSTSARRSTPSAPRSCSTTGASRIATACPFCYIMIDDGAKENGRDDVVVQDISMHLLDALEGGPSTNGGGTETVTPDVGGEPVHQPG